MQRAINTWQYVNPSRISIKHPSDLFLYVNKSKDVVVTWRRLIYIIMTTNIHGHKMVNGGEYIKGSKGTEARVGDDINMTSFRSFSAPKFYGHSTEVFLVICANCKDSVHFNCSLMIYTPTQRNKGIRRAIIHICKIVWPWIRTPDFHIRER
jgi:hypothetical protein